jgi:HlyD family secretion protein
MTADVAILVAHRTSVTKVPNAALRYTPPEGVGLEGSPPTRLERTQRLLYVPGSSPGQLRPVIIRPGISDGVETEVIAGLEPGTPVITATRTLATRGTGLVPPPPPQTP